MLMVRGEFDTVQMRSSIGKVAIDVKTLLLLQIIPINRISVFRSKTV